MGSKEILESEQENLDRIVLYREGLFWKAYERSAYIVYMQVKEFAVTKKSLKVLGGECLVSLGFPSKYEEKYMSGLTVETEEENRKVFLARSEIEVGDFEEWKVGLPLVEGTRGKERGCSGSDVMGGVSPVVEELKRFNLAESTPMECMLFISRLKKIIAEG